MASLIEARAARNADDREDFFRTLGFRPPQNVSAASRNPMNAIRRKCRECAGGSFQEIENCTSSTCPLFAFRLGKNPYRLTSETEGS